MTSTMTRDEAQALRTAHDTDARLLSRKPKYELVAIERSELAAAGRERIFGGMSKDELVASILALRGFGIERMNEATHVLHHQPGEKWSACGWCQCQETWTKPSGFAPGYDQLVQCVLDPGHRGFCRDDQGCERDSGAPAAQGENWSPFGEALEISIGQARR
jgi:hypothetical protein